MTLISDLGIVRHTGLGAPAKTVAPVSPARRNPGREASAFRRTLRYTPPRPADLVGTYTPQGRSRPGHLFLTGIIVDLYV